MEWKATTIQAWEGKTLYSCTSMDSYWTAMAVEPWIDSENKDKLENVVIRLGDHETVIRAQAACEEHASKKAV